MTLIKELPPNFGFTCPAVPTQNLAGKAFFARPSPRRKRSTRRVRLTRVDGLQLWFENITACPTTKYLLESIFNSDLRDLLITLLISAFLPENLGGLFQESVIYLSSDIFDFEARLI
jgi:hypothetical protein